MTTIVALIRRSTAANVPHSPTIARDTRATAAVDGVMGMAPGVDPSAMMTGGTGTSPEGGTGTGARRTTTLEGGIGGSETMIIMTGGEGQQTRHVGSEADWMMMGLQGEQGRLPAFVQLANYLLRWGRHRDRRADDEVRASPPRDNPKAKVGTSYCYFPFEYDGVAIG